MRNEARSPESRSKQNERGARAGCPRFVNENLKTLKSEPVLQRGQLWKVKKLLIRIVDPGTRLVHYRMLRHMGKVRRIRSVALDRMHRFLKPHRARLMNPGCGSSSQFSSHT